MNVIYTKLEGTVHILVQPLLARALTRVLIIEVLYLNPAVKKYITLLLYQTNVKVLKDALAC